MAATLQTAGKAALKAGGIIRDLYGKPHRIRHKGEIDLVTEADVVAEEAILSMLADERPGEAVLAEESQAAYSEIPSGPAWIIDPLDGTTNFAHGFPWFCVSIAYSEAGKTLAGAIYCPMADELFLACQGGGAWLNGSRVRVSTGAALRESLLATGFPYDIQQEADRVMAAFTALVTKAQDIRRAGAAALDLAYVACGRLDGFWEMKLKPWDTAAGQLLVQEAGGLVSTFSGRPFSPFMKEVLASNGAIHAELVALLQQYSRAE